MKPTKYYLVKVYSNPQNKCSDTYASHYYCKMQGDKNIQNCIGVNETAVKITKNEFDRQPGFYKRLAE